MSLGQGGLLVLLLAPLLGVGCALLLSGRTLKLSMWGVVTLLVASTSVLLCGRGAGVWHEVDYPWISALGVRFHLGVDGISWPLVALTALLVGCSVGYLLPQAAKKQLALVFAAAFAMLGVFLALDIVLFVVFFELTLLPFFVLIAFFGSEGRERAARLFLLYTVVGSALLLAGVVLLVANAGTSDLVVLTSRSGHGLSSTLQLTIFILIGLAFAVKSPLWPLHSWLPDAHTAAPTVGSVLLAGILLKLGTYGILRINVGVLPDAMRRSAIVLGFLAVGAIVIAALVCMAQSELKRLVAYSSVGHMGFVLLGVASLNEVGLLAAELGMVAHGLITGLLFFLVGGVRSRYGTGELKQLSALRFDVPRLAAVFGFAAFASFGLPGLAGFWGEAFAILAAGKNGGTWWILAIVAAFGAILGVVYFLRVLRLVVARRESVDLVIRSELAGENALLRPAELAVIVPLAATILILGLWPGAITGIAAAPVIELVRGVAP